MVGSGLGGGIIFVGRENSGLRGYDDETLVDHRFEQVWRNSGGIAYNNFVFEPHLLIPLNPAATIYGLAFVEAGNNFGSYKNYNPFKLYRSTGVGVRIFMAAFGLLGFDYAWRLDDLPGRADDKRGMFHFIIGQQIR